MCLPDPPNSHNGEGEKKDLYLPHVFWLCLQCFPLAESMSHNQGKVVLSLWPLWHRDTEGAKKKSSANRWFLELESRSWDKNLRSGNRWVKEKPQGNGDSLPLGPSEKPTPQHCPEGQKRKSINQWLPSPTAQGIPMSIPSHFQCSHA
jgi:hypothetical protein